MALASATEEPAAEESAAESPAPNSDASQAAGSTISPSGSAAAPPLSPAHSRASLGSTIVRAATMLLQNTPDPEVGRQHAAPSAHLPREEDHGGGTLQEEIHTADVDVEDRPDLGAADHYAFDVVSELSPHTEPPFGGFMFAVFNSFYSEASLHTFNSDILLLNIIRNMCNENPRCVHMVFLVRKVNKNKL